jgi:hypothetical protein
MKTITMTIQRRLTATVRYLGYSAGLVTRSSDFSTVMGEPHGRLLDSGT